MLQLNNMKKTLIITNFFPPAIGGIEKYFEQVCSRLPAEAVVVLTTNNAAAADSDKAKRYKIIRTDFFSGKYPPRWKPLKKTIKKIIKEEGIEQIIFGHFHPYALLGRSFGLPYYIFGHGTDIRQIKTSWWQKRAFRKAARSRLCRKVIANSRFIYDEMAAVLKNKAKLEVIYPGVDISGLNMKTDLAARRELLGIKADDIVLLSVGRVEAEKNFASVIALMPKLLAVSPNVKYLIVGDGSALSGLQAQAEQLAVKYNVIFTGAVTADQEALGAYYQLSHIFITPSLKPEGFGISYLEASATRTVPIASKFGGSSEAIKDGETGLLIDPAKRDELEKAILALISDNYKWTQLADAGEAWAANFDWPKQMEKIVKILN